MELTGNFDTPHLYQRAGYTLAGGKWFAVWTHYTPRAWEIFTVMDGQRPVRHSATVSRRKARRIVDGLYKNRVTEGYRL